RRRRDMVGWCSVSNYDAAVPPTSAFVVLSCEPPCEAHYSTVLLSLFTQPRVASAAPAASFIPRCRKSASLLRRARTSVKSFSLWQRSQSADRKTLVIRLQAQRFTLQGHGPTSSPLDKSEKSEIQPT